MNENKETAIELTAIDAECQQAEEPSPNPINQRWVDYYSQAQRGDVLWDWITGHNRPGYVEKVEPYYDNDGLVTDIRIIIMNGTDYWVNPTLSPSLLFQSTEVVDINNLPPRIAGEDGVNTPAPWTHPIFSVAEELKNKCAEQTKVISQLNKELECVRAQFAEESADATAATQHLKSQLEKHQSLLEAERNKTPEAAQLIEAKVRLGIIAKIMDTLTEPIK